MLINFFNPYNTLKIHAVIPVFQMKKQNKTGVESLSDLVSTRAGDTESGSLTQAQTLECHTVFLSMYTYVYIYARHVYIIVLGAVLYFTV